ncbi:hypothetical protein [Caldiplasma sukawensis]
MTNNQSEPTPSPFQEMVVINSKEYASVENCNLSNVWFSYLNGTRIPSWLESGNSRYDSNSTYWLKINSSIPAGVSVRILINFLPIGQIAFNNWTGEAPQLSRPYGIYDDGKQVFNFYDNFSGTSLKSSIWNVQGVSSAFSIDNGISFLTCTALVSKVSFKSASEIEAYGIINTPEYNNSTSYFLNGVGYGNGGMDCSSPVMTAGWAEANSNMLGLSIWVGNGVAYTYNASKSLSPYDYHVFGVGYLGNGSTALYVDNKIQNVSGFPNNTGISMNVVLGFQARNSPKIFHFYWIFEKNSTKSGQNLPFKIYTSTIQFQTVGLPVNVPWTLSIQGSMNFNSTGGVPIIANLVNGTFRGNVSAGDGYIAYPNSMCFLVNGNSEAFIINFESPYNASLIRSETTFFPGNGSGLNSVSGYQISYFSPPMGFYAPFFVSMALDNVSNKLFATFSVNNTGNGGLVWENLTNRTSGHIELANFSNQMGLYFNYKNNYIYVPDKSGIIIINASNMKIVKNVSIKHVNVLALSFNPESDTFYVYSINSTSKTNITTINQNGQITGNLSFPSVYLSSRQLSEFISPPVYYLGTLMISNATGIVIYNLTDGTQKFVKAPSNYIPITLLPYGHAGSFLVGDSNYSATYSYVYNSSSGLFTKGPSVSGEVVASAFNPLNGDYYIWSEGQNIDSGNITVFNPINNRIVGKVPSPIAPNSDMIFDSSNQLLYVLSGSISSMEALPSLYVYSTQHQYNIQFTKSGLPSMYSWSISIKNEVSSGQIYGNKYSTYLPNGTYAVSVRAYTSLYHPLNTTFSIYVNGSDKSVDVSFILTTFEVTFIENGLPVGTTWSIVLNNVTHTVNSNSVILNLQNGSYRFSVSANGYIASNQSGFFNISGNNIVIRETFQEVKTNGLTPYYTIFGILAAIAVAATGIIIWRKRRQA